MSSTSETARETMESTRHSSAVLAPAWHTALLIGLILAVALTGTWLSCHGVSPSGAPNPSTVLVPPHRLTAVYLPMVITQWGLVAYVARVGRPKNELAALLGRSAASGKHRRLGVAVDLMLALACALVVVLTDAALRALSDSSGVTVGTANDVVIPRTLAERLAWVVVASSVGFCEEVVYRGYLRTQLTAFFGSSSAAVVVQAILFGFAHAEQGGSAIVRATVHGVVLGGLAWWRGSLRPGILAHAGLDIGGGLARSFASVT